MQRWFLISIGILILVSCNYKKDGIISPSHLYSGTYRYTGYDSTGVAIVKGWLTLDFSDSSQVTGEWDFKKIGKSSQVIGPQTGEGDLTGRFDDGKLWISLNPYIDYNVFLSGQLINNMIYTGNWTYSNFFGPRSWGTFKAVRN